MKGSQVKINMKQSYFVKKKRSAYSMYLIYLEINKWKPLFLDFFNILIGKGFRCLTKTHIFFLQSYRQNNDQS